MYSINVKLITLFFLFNIIACNEVNDERHKMLAGKWFLYKAEVDGAATDRLDGAIYEFVDGRIKTNIPQIGEGAYSLDQENIIQKGEPNIKYAIEHLDDAQLILKMTIRDISFRLELGRDSLLE